MLNDPTNLVSLNRRAVLP